MSVKVVLPILVACALTSRVLLAGEASAGVAALRSEAERGNVIAEYNLGIAYQEGRGVGADPVEAFVWLSLAADNGSASRALETLLSSLSDQQLAEGRERLEARRAITGSATVVPVPPTPTPPVSSAPSPAPPASPAEIRPAASPETAASHFTPPTFKSTTPLPAPPPGTPRPPDLNLGPESAEMVRLREEVASLRTERQQLSSQISALQSSIAHLEDSVRTNDAASSDLARLQDRLATSESQREQLTADLNAARDTIATLQNSLQAVRQQLAASPPTEVADTSATQPPDLQDRLGGLQGQRQ